MTESRRRLLALTGATGFIGRRLARRLVAAGWRVRALCRRTDDELAALGVEAVAGDLADDEALARLTEGAEVTVHGAGAVRAPSAAAFFAVNRDGSRRLAAAVLAKAAAPRLLLISSLAAREPSLSPYAASKRAAEEALLGLADRLDLAIVRPPAVYGPGDPLTLELFRQLARRRPLIPGRPEARFSLLFVDDLADAVARLAAQTHWGGVILEPDDGRRGGYGWLDLVAVAARQFGHGARPLFLPRALLWPAALVSELIGRGFGAAPVLTRGKLRELFHGDWVCRPTAPAIADWRPRVGFGDGFPLTWQWYREHGWA